MMRYRPDRKKVATSLACGLLVPLPIDTEVVLGHYATEVGDGPVVPPAFPKLRSPHVYVYAQLYGWAVVDKEDLNCSSH